MSEGHLAPGVIEGEDSLYRTLVDLSPDAIVIHVEGRIVFINRAGLQLLRAGDPSQVLGRSVLDFVHPDDHALVLERIRATRTEPAMAPLIEERFVALDGSEFAGET